MRYDLTLMEILIRCLRKWRLIAACALAGAVLLAAFGAVRSLASLSNAGDTGSVDGTPVSDTAEGELLRIEREKQEVRDYLDQSILLQLNPLSFSRGNLVFCVTDVQAADEANSNQGNEISERLTRLYGHHVRSQILMQGIIEELDLPYDSRILQEIIGGYYANGVIQITVDHTDAAAAADLLDRIEAYLLAQRGALSAEIADHDLLLIDKSVAPCYDYELILSQSNMKSRCEEILSGLDEKEQELQESGVPETFSPSLLLKQILKYFLFGGAAGVIISGGCLMLLILFSNKVMDEKDLLKRYKIKVLAVYRGKL